MSSQRFQVDGIHVEAALPDGGEQASRPPLLLVHGAGHGAWCWEKWMGVLPGRGWACHALSLRNHPGSDPVDDETFRTRLRVSDYAADLRKVTAHIGRPCVAIGHSLGGIVVQKYLAEQTAAGKPEAAAVLLASAPPGQLGPIRDAPLPTDTAHEMDRQTARERYFYSADEAVWGPAVERLVPESPSVMNDYSLGDGLPIAPGDIPCPTLVVSAEHDRSAAPSDGRIAEYLGAEFFLAEGIGHDLMLDEGWEAVLERVEAWLAALFPEMTPPRNDSVPAD